MLQAGRGAVSAWLTFARVLLGNRLHARMGSSLRSRLLRQPVSQRTSRVGLPCARIEVLDAQGAPSCGVRRMRMAGAALLLVLAGACSREDPPPPLQVELLVFGSPATLQLHAADASRAQAAVQAVSARLASLHHEWHAWEPGPLVELNAALAAGATTAPAPPSVRALVARARPLVEASDGLFDPAIGGLVRLWGFHTSSYPLQSPPPAAAVLQAWRDAAPTLQDLRQLPDGRLRSDNPAVQLDFGAIAEGAAAAEVAALLDAHGISDALLALGGDVLALGSNHGRPWRVGIVDGRGVLAGVELGDGEALFTSGNYSKYRTAADGSRWPHVLDPRSGQPATGVRVASVLHNDPLRADVAATALLVGGAARFVDLVERLQVRCALLLTDDDQLLVTAAMQQRIAMQRPLPARAKVHGAPGPCMPGG